MFDEAPGRRVNNERLITLDYDVEAVVEGILYKKYHIKFCQKLGKFHLLILGYRCSRRKYQLTYSWRTTHRLTYSSTR
jgi:hypothetical protein